MDLHVKFDGHEIIVTRPGTDFILAYRKRPDSPNLVSREAGKSLPSRHPRLASSERTHFRLRAPRRASSGGFDLSMKKISIFLQTVIVLIGIGAVALLLWEPHIEGRNAHATLFQIYFNDPFLAYAYIASVPFFVALYQAFKVLGYAGQNEVFSQEAVKGLRAIKYCAISIIGFVAGGEISIMLGDSDDRAGGVFIGLLISFSSLVIAAAAAMFERILQSAVDMKLENDLTV